METMSMSRKERKRLEAFSRVKRGELKLSKAAELLGLSYRQSKRAYARYREQGDAGLAHRLRGRASNRGSAAERREQVLELYREKYADFGPTLAGEYLARQDGQAVAVTTLRRWLLAAALWQAQRRRSPHRRWRPRREYLGEMVQMDGSLHDWFEGRRAKATLMVMIDDATSRIYARFFEEETTAAAMEVFQRYVQRHGLPRSLYVDRDSIYQATRDATSDEELRETGPLTQFGRAMQELEVELILAYSPQAKGRVERCHGTLQDRLIQGAAAGGHQRPGGGQRSSGGDVLAPVQRAVQRAGRTEGGLASAGACACEAGACALVPGESRGAERLDGVVAESLFPVNGGEPQFGFGSETSAGVRAAGRSDPPGVPRA